MVSFSVIMPTRNRPALFQAALASVLDQTCLTCEVIVVADGVSAEHRSSYETIAAQLGENAQFYWLDQSQRGHGSSYTINFGAAVATGDYFCFLDDDDYWTDRDYLARVGRVLEASSEPVDLHFSNQIAYLGDRQQPGPIWVENLAEVLPNRGRHADSDGTFRVDVADLLAVQGFCHLNTLIIRRGLFTEINGLDTTIWWENDRDFYLRAIDRARCMRYAPQIVARHNVPDPTKSANLTTATSELQKRLYQLRVFDKAILFAEHMEIKAHGRRHRAYTLKRITENLAANARYSDASYYARQALAAGPTVKWALYTALLSMRALVSNRGSA